jgi:hypothetical protein
MAFADGGVENEYPQDYPDKFQTGPATAEAGNQLHSQTFEQSSGIGKDWGVTEVTE